MANEPITTKDQKPSGAEADEELMSLEALDYLINEQDPDFKGAMNAISAEKTGIGTNIELLDLDQLLAEEHARSFKERFKRFKKRTLRKVASVATSVRLFIKNELPTMGKTILGWLKQFADRAKEAIRQFGFKPLKFRLLVFAFIGICALVGTAMTMLLTKGVPEPQPLFMRSLGELAEETHEFDPAKDQEAFYDSVRVAQNVLVITKLVVNLKRVPSSGENPMAAAELFVEGNSPDVVVELKARETEFRDAFLRTMEEFNAADLELVSGKQRVLDRLAREANRLVTKGRVKKIYFKTFILNP